jgi:hypothetical protein
MPVSFYWWRKLEKTTNLPQVTSIILVFVSSKNSNVSQIAHTYIELFLLKTYLYCLTPLATIIQLYHASQFLLVEETGENHQPATSH